MMRDSDRTSGSGRPGSPGDAPTLQPFSAEDVEALPPGTVLAGRYEIIQTLGIGGMGAVYKTFDRQLTRVVALKTILPDLASAPAALKRFKQEVLLAQQVVHKNVVRIFDIGEDGGTKFITMDFVEGVDLKTLVRERGKLPPAEAVAIVREVCSALEAAHAAGVVHRDLKPQNIMIEKDGHVLVMDFGIAQSSQTRGATQTGSIMGTPDYMSPEQARTEDVDARSDLFSLGLIFYEILTGKLALRADTVLETMFRRTKERATPPAEIDASVPKAANDIIMKCLEMERERRYQTATEILTDLEKVDPSKRAGAAVHIKARLRKVSRYRNWIAAALVLALAAASGLLLRNQFLHRAETAHAPVTALVADFNNHTGNPVFDGALEPIVKLALEEAAFINVYDRTRMRADLGLAPIAGRLDEAAARKVAVGQGLGVVIAASLDRVGAGYTILMKATEAVTGKDIRTVEGAAADKDQVLFTTTKLAAALRKALGDDTSDSAQRFAMESLSATSLEAVHEYATAMDALSNARYENALSSFSKALDVDPNFGLAYAGMAVASRAMGQQQDAEKHIKLALTHVDRMTERERYRTRGFYYALAGDRQKCVEEYASLINRFPSDAAAHNNLAFCWSDLRNMPKALDHVRHAASILPKRLTYRLNISLFASYGGDFQGGEREARTAQALDSSSRFGFIALAFGQMGQGQLAQAAETYRKLEKLSKLGASDARSGLADIALYEGRFNDAIQILEQGAGEDLAAKYPDRAAEKFAALAYTRLLQGQKGLAVAAAERALTSSKIVKIQFLAGRVLAAAGQAARAQTIADGLASESQSEPQAYAKQIQGEIARTGGDPRKAIQLFAEANNLLDTWIGHFDLGRAYLEAGLFTEADSEFDRCTRRRGEALSLFLDQSPTYGYFPLIYYYVGRVREGLNSKGFADSYKTYISIRGKAGEDPLLAEARKRAGE